MAAINIIASSAQAAGINIVAATLIKVPGTPPSRAVRSN